MNGKQPTFERPMVYIISTCPRCKAVKAYLDQLGIHYDLVAVDLISPEERQEVISYLRKYRPVVSFPVIEAGDIVLIGSNVLEVESVFGGRK